MDIWEECLIIQKKLTKRPRKSQDDVSRIFSKLMFEAKVGAALRFLEDNADNAVLASSETVINKLKELHPPPADIVPEALIEGPLKPVNPAFFNSIDEQEILKAASRTKGSAGPSMMDAKQWNRILCSKHFKNEGKNLRENIAEFARKIATEIIDPRTIDTFVASRLIPLNKDPDSVNLQVRPIGVGEVLRRIVGKAISRFRSKTRFLST